MNGLLIILVVGAIMVGLIVFGHLAAKKRREELFKLATRLGLQFDPDSYDVHDDFDGFSPFGVGSSRRSSNLLHGRLGEIEWEIFDYKYTTGSGKNKSTHHVSIVAAAVPIMLPRMTIRPEGLFDKIVSIAGFDDINFESEEFSRRFHVKCADRKLCYDLIHPQMIEFLLSSGPAHWQFAGTNILITASGHLAAADIERNMRMIEGFVERIPQYLKQERGLRNPDTVTR
jgi:hypothetical protein